MTPNTTNMTHNTQDHDGTDLDQDLDAEDVSAATMQRAEETHVSSGKVRDAYYNTYCYLRDLQDAALDLKDRPLRKHATMMLDKLDDIHEHLEANYQWD